MNIVKVRLLIAIAVIAGLFSSCNQSKDKTQNNDGRVIDMMSAVVVFDDTLFNFRNFPSIEPVKKHTFTFTNKGKIPAVILSATPSCHCTSVEYPKEAIMPGKQGDVTVIYDGTDQKPEYFEKSVRLRFNSERQHVLRIKGQMTAE